MDWRKIEQALVEIAKSNDLWIEDNDGEPSIQCMPAVGDCEYYVISLSDLAKELAERLG